MLCFLSQRVLKFPSRYAYLTGIRDYVLNKKDFIASQVGNPEGEDKPNKKYFE